MTKIESKSSIKLGVVPTHIQFLDGLVPDDNGNMPRDDEGQLKVVSRMQGLADMTQAKIDCVQVSMFPGVADADYDEMVKGLESLGMEVHVILMVGGAGNPMDPADENAVVDCLVECLESAAKRGLKTVGSTSLEPWMTGGERKEGADFDAAVEQIIKVHLKAYEKSNIADSSIESWNIEFLRDVEFATFTDVGRAWQLVDKANEALGRPFFQVLVDAAHCGDSQLSLDENIGLIEEIGASDGLSVFHASAKTTRGCITTDDGWIGALLSACARTGKLEYVYAEMFHHEDPALQSLRDAVPGHGVDTTDGRTYDEMISDALNSLSHRLNNLAQRGIGGTR
ncbi:hypothetical protein [Mariniblastus fucicola]|uniref:Xylose isomerase-like TIM barrel n=1 Tax=Mariniblastus fucicola TaxID=980251 RepID=A0A5B9PIR8_9BACT|nr:hypothetical protein [Mariniblastus fucicola]QEG22513.1 hypothetical protein MFFC18_23940 [Mariniblastus fucicola]